MLAFDKYATIKKLRAHHVSVTKNRIAVLKVLTQHKAGVTISAIVKFSDIPLDRISIYRSLQVFLQKGLVQLVPNNSGHLKYILADNAIKNQVSHFVCTNCGHKELIQQPVIEQVNIQTDLHAQKFNLLIEGLCEKCRRKIS